MTVGRFLVINAVGWRLMFVSSALAVLVARLRRPVAGFAALFLVNGSVHLLGTLASGSYSPGVASGLLPSVPAGALTLAKARQVLSPSAPWLSAFFGTALNVVAFAVAFAGG